MLFNFHILYVKAERRLHLMNIFFVYCALSDLNSVSLPLLGVNGMSAHIRALHYFALYVQKSQRQDLF